MDPENSLRGDIEAALGGDGASTESPTPEQTPTPEPSSPAPAPAPAPESGAPAEAVAKPKGDRDSLGRFLPKDEAKLAVAPNGAAPTPTDPGLAAAPLGAASIPAPAPVELQPPAGMPPTAREHWGATPPQVREFISQREQQMQRWANDTAPLRNTGQQFMQAISPFQMAIQAEGVDPITAVTNLMQVGTTLRFGTPLEKAQTVARIVSAYGVDLQTLDSALAGVAPPEGQPQVNVQAEVQRALAPLMQAAQQRQQAEYQQLSEAARNDLVAFAQDPAHEFMGDVRLLMADMLDVADRQKMDLSLQDAYDRSCALHPEVSKVIMARRQGANAQQLTAAAQRAKSAAVSVRGVAPVGNPNAVEPSSIRESIEAAIEAHSRV